MMWVMTIERPMSRWVDLDGPVHHVCWEGPEDRSFVLVHGLGGSVLSWLAVGPGLARHGRVFALDLAGFGRSPRAGRRTRVSDQRRLLARFIDEVVGGGPVVLCGNSMGGATSMLHAAVEPDEAEALVLSNSVFPWVWGAYPAPVVMAGFGLYQLPRVGEWMSRQRLNGLDAERAVRVGLGIIAADATRIDPELVAAHVEQLSRLRQDDDAGGAFLEAARSLMALGRRRRVARWILDSVRCPTLVVHGRSDRLVPYRFAEAAVRGRPGWQLVAMGGVGHIPQMEAPERWLAVVERWLERQTSSPAAEPALGT
jgi:pimeloyl-ACP methyl ester carboxylesterase